MASTYGAVRYKDGAFPIYARNLHRFRRRL